MLRLLKQKEKEMCKLEDKLGKEAGKLGRA